MNFVCRIYDIAIVLLCVRRRKALNHFKNLTQKHK